MAHEISVTEEGVVEAAFANVPWHGLGFIANERMQVMEALDRANLNWLVDTVPLFIKSSSGDFVEVDDKKAVIRCDTEAYLGTVGNRYVPIQNKEQADFLEALVGEGAVVEAVGALFGGRKIFWTIKVPGNIIVGKEDRVDQYLILMNAHDGTKSFIVFWSPIRVVCNNTLNAALGLRDARDGFCIRHTANAKDRIEQARHALKLASDYYELIGENFKEMHDTEISLPRFNSGLMDLIPEKLTDKGEESSQRIKTRDTIRMNFTRGIGAKLAGQTAWGFFNAVTLYTSHQRTPSSTRDRRFESIMYGSSRKMTQDAFDIALSMKN